MAYITISALVSLKQTGTVCIGHDGIKHRGFAQEIVIADSPDVTIEMIRSFTSGIFSSDKLVLTQKVTGNGRGWRVS